MLIVVLSLLALAAVPLVGGDLRRLSAVSLRWSFLLPVALVVQIVFLGVLDEAPRGVVAGAHGVSYVLAAAFLWRNRRLRGLWLLAVGAACNALTIGLNGGTLPASEQALLTAGRELKAEGFQNSGLLEDPLLPFMGDVFAVPAWLPFANVFSIGDVLILAGLLWVLHSTCVRVRVALAAPDPLRELAAEQLRAEVAAARRQLAAARTRQAELHAQLCALRGTAPAPQQRYAREPALAR